MKSDGTVIERKTAKGSNGQLFREEDIQASLEAVADSLEKHFPGVEWRMVEKAPNDFNFIQIDHTEGDKYASTKGSPIDRDRGEGVPGERTPDLDPGSGEPGDQ